MSNNNQTPTEEKVEVKATNKVVEVKAKDVAKYAGKIMLKYL